MQNLKLFHTLFLDAHCIDEDECTFWTYQTHQKICSLKLSDANRKSADGAVSGSKGCSAGNNKDFHPISCRLFSKTFNVAQAGLVIRRFKSIFSYLSSKSMNFGSLLLRKHNLLGI